MASATVAVGCKLPHGLHLQLYAPVVKGEVAQPIGERVTLKGANSTVNESLIMHAGTFGVTEGVDKEFIEKWLKDNASLDAVRNGLIFVHEKEVSVRAEGKAKKQLETGFEGKDPGKMPAGLKKLDKKTTDDE